MSLVTGLWCRLHTRTKESSAPDSSYRGQDEEERTFEPHLEILLRARGGGCVIPRQEECKHSHLG